MLNDMEGAKQHVTIALAFAKHLEKNPKHREFWLDADPEERLDFWLKYYDNIDMIV